MIDATQILINLSTVIGPVYHLVTGAAYLIGISFAFKALYKLKIYGETRTMMSSNASLKEPLTYLFVAMMLIYLPTGFDIMMETTFGYQNVLRYADWPGSGGTALGPASIAMLGIVQVVGAIAFVRGWILITKSSAQGAQGGLGRGLTHIFGGLFAMNIVGTASMLSNTLGVSFG